MNLKIPHGRFGSADYLEPITKDYPEFGTGGAIQAISRRPIKLNRIIDLSNGRTIYEIPRP